MIREGGQQMARLRVGSQGEIIESLGTRALAAEERESGLGHSSEKFALELSGLLDGRRRRQQGWP